MGKYSSYVNVIIMILGIHTSALGSYGDETDITPPKYTPEKAMVAILDEVSTNNISDALDYRESVNADMAFDQFETAFQALRNIYENYETPDKRIAALVAVFQPHPTYPDPAPKLSPEHVIALNALFKNVSNKEQIIRQDW
jgi:hypothetical protein